MTSHRAIALPAIVYASTLLLCGTSLAAVSDSKSTTPPLLSKFLTSAGTVSKAAIRRSRYSGPVDPAGLRLVHPTPGATPQFVPPSPGHIELNSDADWSSVFGPAGADYGTVHVNAAAIYNGDLILAGEMNITTSTTSSSLEIARWDGSQWHSMGSSSFNAPIYALTVSNGYLIAGGDFLSYGGLGDTCLAQWNGTWAKMDPRLTPMPPSGGGPRQVRALAVYGTKLYVGGQFSQVGPTVSSNIAMWDSVTGASALGLVSPGVDAAVHALTVYNGLLYIGGEFSHADTAGVSLGWTGSYGKLVSWNGTTFGSVGAGVDGVVYALAPYKGGVAVGGTFTHLGDTQAVHGLGIWHDGAWKTLGSNASLASGATVRTLASWNNRLIVGGTFTATTAVGHTVTNLANYVYSNYTGSSWDSIGGSADQEVLVADSVNATTLAIGGSFSKVGAVGLDQMGIGNNTALRPFGNGVKRVGIYTNVDGLCVDGSNIYAVGEFAEVGGVPDTNVARWNGSSWDAIPGLGTVSAGEPQVKAITKFGTAIIAGGSFTTPLGLIAQRTTGAWSSLGSGITTSTSATVNAFLVQGSSLLVGGHFTSPADNTKHNIAAWGGSSWSSYGTIDSTADVTAFAVFRDSVFAAAGTGVYKYSAGSWVAVPGLQMNDQVFALAAVGNYLYVGGVFTDVSGVNASSYVHVLRWDGSSRAALSGVLDGTVRQLTRLECGLVAAGDITGGVARLLAGTWESMGSTSPYGLDGYTNAILANGRQLWVGGRFARAGGKPSLSIALYTDTYAGIDSVSTLALTMGHTTAKVTWSTPGPSSLDCPRDSFSVRYSTSPITESTFPTDHILDSGDPGDVDTEHCEVLDGRRGTYFGVKVYDSGGIGSPLATVHGAFTGGNEEVTECDIGNTPPPGGDDMVALAGQSVGRAPIAIEFAIRGRRSTGVLSVFSVSGRCVRRLELSDPLPDQGLIAWDGKDSGGRRVPAGVYFARLTVGKLSTARRLILLP
jgi:hypothetical protein